MLHVADGVHATAEPQHVLDCGWDLAAIGEGEATILALVRALRDGDGVALRTPVGAENLCHLAGCSADRSAARPAHARPVLACQGVG